MFQWERSSVALNIEFCVISRKIGVLDHCLCDIYPVDVLLVMSQSSSCQLKLLKMLKKKFSTLLSIYVTEAQ